MEAAVLNGHRLVRRTYIIGPYPYTRPCQVANRDLVNRARGAAVIENSDEPRSGRSVAGPIHRDIADVDRARSNVHLRRDLLTVAARYRCQPGGRHRNQRLPGIPASDAL